MPSSQKSKRKVSVSIGNWITGGSLLSLTSTNSDTRRRQVSGRRVVLTEIDSDDNEIVVKSGKNPKSPKSEKKSKKEGHGDGKKEEKKGDDGGKKDGEEKQKDGEDQKKDKDKDKEKKKCKTCGKNIVEDGAKTDDAKKDSAAEKKGDNKKSDKSKDKSDHGGCSSSWTSEQDSKLREMKADNKSWKEITAEIGFSKQDAAKRFKELQSNHKSCSPSPSPDAGKEQDDTTGWGGLEDSGWNNGGGGYDSGMASFGDLFMDSTPAPKREKQASSWSKGAGGNGKIPSFEDLFMDDTPTPAEKSTSSWKNGDHADTRNGSKQGMDNKGGKNQFENNGGGSWTDSNLSYQQEQGRLRTNGIWSADDCEVLEMLEGRYKEEKWLHIQAAFYNWSGRMISADLIEKKFRDDGAA